MALIRDFEKGDVPEVYEIGIKIPEFEVNLLGRTTFRFWSKDTLERISEQGFSCVVENNQKIEGFLLATFQPVTRKLTWENMYLTPNYRDKGIAYECFQRIWKRAECAGVELAEGMVTQDNLESLGMLYNLEFTSAGLYYWMLRIPLDRATGNHS